MLLKQKIYTPSMASQALPQDRDNKSQKGIKELFAGRTLVIASMHEKEKVLQPLLEEQLGVKVVVAKELNTDQFGAFSGEVARTLSPIETARQKCNAAQHLTKETIVLASEGSFGPHPVLGFVPANEELLLLKDYKENMEFVAKVTSLQTNFSGQAFKEWEDVVAFASRVGFPSHGLIVRSDRDDSKEMHKGICNWEALEKSFHYFRDKEGKVFVETEMRALYNPTRMKVIAEAAAKLIAIIQKACPACNRPGFAVKEVETGLPCSLCGTPTRTIKAHLYSCQCCGHKEVLEFPDRKKQEDPMFCDICNP